MGKGLKSWQEDTQDIRIESTSGWNIQIKGLGNLLDMSSGGSAFILGYSNKEVSDSISEILGKVSRCQPNLGQTMDLMEECADHICNTGNWDYYIWAQSGTDAVEAAIAINDAYWKNSKHKIISFTPAWHGTSFLTKSMGIPQLAKTHRNLCIPTAKWDLIDQREFEESKCMAILEKHLQEHKNIGCVVIDPNPWFLGYHPWSKEFLIFIRKICDQYNVLMIGDDVGSCYGKGTDTWHSFPPEAQPDICAVGKAISAGYAPISAALTKEHIQKKISSNFGYAHTLSPYVGGLAALKTTKDIIIRDNLFSKIPYIKKNLAEVGDRLINLGLVSRYRQGDGISIGYDIPEYIDMSESKKFGLSAKMNKTSTIRVSAPLIANDTYFFELEEKMKNLIKGGLQSRN